MDPDADLFFMTFIQQNKDFQNCSIMKIYNCSQIIINDYVRNKIVSIFEIHDKSLEYIYELNDGSFVSTDESTMCRWTIKRGEEPNILWTVDIERFRDFHFFAVISNNKLIFVNENIFHVFDTSTGKEIFLKDGSCLKVVQFNQDYYDEFGDDDYALNIINLESLGNNTFVTLTAFASVIEWTITDGNDGTYFKFSAREIKQDDIPRVDEDLVSGNFYSLASYKKDGVAEVLAVLCSERTVCLFKLPEWRLIWKDNSDNKYKYEESGRLCFSPCGRLLAYTTIHPLQIKVVNVRSGHLVGSNEKDFGSDDFVCFCFHPFELKILDSVSVHARGRKLDMTYYEIERPFKEQEQKIASLLSLTKYSDLAYDGEAVFHKLFQNIKQKLI